jgi:hypothetical protein
MILISPCLGFPESRIPKAEDKVWLHSIAEYAMDWMFDQKIGGPPALLRTLPTSWGRGFIASNVSKRWADRLDQKEVDLLTEYLVEVRKKLNR